MYKRLFVFLLLACVLLCLHARKTKVLLAGFGNQSPPYEFAGKDGRLTGSNIDILNAVAKDSKLKIKTVHKDWSEIRNDLDNRNIQLLAGMVKTSEREKHYLFTLPHTFIHFAVFIRRDSPQLSDWSDLKGKRVLVVSGNVMEEIMQEKKLGAVLLPVNNSLEAILKLSNGVGDAVLLPKIQGFMYIAENHLDNVIDSGNLGYAMPYCIALPPGSEELCSKLNSSIIKLNNNNQLRKIQNKWFGIYDREDTILDRHRSIYRIALVLVILGLGIVGFLNYTLARRIKLQKRILTQQIRERNNYEMEFNRRHQLFVTGPIVFMKWNDTDREMFDSISGNFAAFGYNTNDILTSKIHFRSIIHPDDLEWVLADRKNHLEKRSYSYFQIYRIICPIQDNSNGLEPVINLWRERNIALSQVNMVQLRWVYDYTVIMPDDLTNTYHFYGYLLDISKQKAFESELIKQHSAAQVAIHTKDAFLARVSAEINSPLNALIGLIRKITTRHLPEEQSVAMQTITNSAMHLKQILQQIHDFLSILKGSMGSEPQWYVLRTLLEPIITEFQVKLAGDKIAFEYQEYQPSALVFLDCDWFQKIIRIVLDNALKFTQAGKISLTIDLFTDVQDKAELFVKVADTGVGIPPDKLSMIMEPFTQVDESFTRRFGGIGLGLSIARNLLIQMNGKISIQSVPQNGTTVELRFPVESK